MAIPARERKFSIFDVGRKLSSAYNEYENLARQMTNMEITIGDLPKEGAGDTVLIGVDGSRAADDAIVWYLENLHKRDNLLILVHALENPTMPTRETWESQVQVGKRKQEELQERYVTRFKEWGISGRFLSDMEKPGELIISSAKKRNATYIVMGSRGLGRVRRTLLGSVSDYVLHHSECPVVVART